MPVLAKSMPGAGHPPALAELDAHTGTECCVLLPPQPLIPAAYTPGCAALWGVHLGHCQASDREGGSSSGGQRAHPCLSPPRAQFRERHTGAVPWGDAWPPTCTCTTCTLIHAHAHMHIHARAHAHINAHGCTWYMHVHMRTCPYQCTWMHTHMVHAHACTCIYTHLRCTHVHECSYTCTCMHTHATFGGLMNEGGVLVGAEERDRCVRSFLAQLLNFLRVLR